MSDASGASTRRLWVARHPFVTLIAAALVVLAVALVVATQQGEARRASAAAACREEVASRYAGDEPTIFVDYVGGRDRPEFSAVDTAGRFRWTCIATQTDDGWTLSVWK